MTMNMDLHPQFITNEKGEKLSVVLPINEYEELLEDLNDLSTIVSRKNEDTITHDEFLKELKKDGLL